MEFIFRDKKFFPLFWTQFLGALNDNFFKNALVMLITYRAVQIGALDSKLLVPLAGGIFIFPFFIFSATAGQMADKYQKAAMIKAVKFSEILVMCLASLALYLDNYSLLLVVLFFMGAQSAFFGPLKYGIIPSLVAKERLVLANAFVSAGTFIAILLGTIAGGAFIEFDSYVFALSTGLLLLAILGFAFSLKVEDVPIAPSERLKVDYTFFRPTWQILKLTAKNKEIFQTVLGISWYWFLGAAVLSLLPLFVKDILGGGTQVATFFLAIFTIGMGLGAYLTERISKNEVEIGLVPISALGMSLFLVFLCSVGLWAEGSLHEGAELLSLSAFFDRTWSIPAVLSLLGMATFGGGYIVPQMSYLQVKARPSELSQTIAGNNIWNALFMVTAAVVVMLLTKTIGISKSFAVLAALNGTISLWLYFLYSEKTLRLWMIFLSKVFYRVEVTGLENFPKEGAVILVSNHVSFVDWVILMGLIPRPIHFVIDYNYYYLPTGPFWFKQAGLVPIATRRESEEVLTSAFKAISRDLDEGSVIGVFPEGAITRDGKMRRFQPGVQKIVKNRSVPIVLASMDGLWGSIFSFKGGRVLFKRPESFRKRIKVTLSHPIESEIYDPIEAKAWVESQLETLE